LSLAAALWFMGMVWPAGVIHAAAVGGLMTACAAGTSTAAFDTRGWLAYHALNLACTLVAVLVLSAGWAGSGLEGIGPAFGTREGQTRLAERVKRWFPTGPARRWVESVSLLVVLLAVGGAWGDPAKPYWSSAVILSISALLGALAIWMRSPAYVAASGLMVN